MSLEIRSGFQFQARSRADRGNDVSDEFPNSIGKETYSIYYLHSILEKAGGSTKTSQQLHSNLDIMNLDIVNFMI